MSKLLKADIAVIGAGSGGLSVAAGAAMLGLKVILFEKGEMGGDCLQLWLCSIKGVDFRRPRCSGDARK